MTESVPARTWTHVDLVPYDPRWPLRFARTARELREVLSGARIEHVGSTSVPGMASKDTIDTAVGVTDVDGVLSPAVLSRLAERGFVHRPRSFAENPDHAFFVRIVGDRRTDHVHIMREGSPTFRDLILFRDHLRAHPAAAAEYMRIKQGLAARFADRRAEYVAQKTLFVDALMRRVRDAHGVVE
ncbi:GrpB family protein [Brachybacterium phenoliresistens]|uniref:GrpB family protein n=1 Tax=Brachybacterium phenoliresistens TaxID=396014 RepID=UPI0031D81D89